MQKNKWFEVSKGGLAKVHAERDKRFIIFELCQNAWDEKSTLVTITLTEVSPGKYELTVTDDNPQGFIDLAHSYRMFEESLKKDNPEQRGRFNIGEKLFLALCDSAIVSSTTGTIYFNADGTRTETDLCTPVGTRITAILPLTQAEFTAMVEGVELLIPPSGITTTFNGKPLVERAPRTLFVANLGTVLGDTLRRTTRKTGVEVYDPLPGETAFIYEMGIPIVETGDRYHVNVKQKVPLNTDRDNVPPAYLRHIRTETLNATFADVLTEEDATQEWVRSALGDERITADAIRQVIKASYGDKVVAHDPRDSAASSTAVSEGYRVIHGGAFSKDAWKQIKAAEVLDAASKLFPTPKPYSDDPDAPPVQIVPESEYTPGMHDVVRLAKELAMRFLKRRIEVLIVNAKGGGFSACFGGGELHFNLANTGRRWYDLEVNLASVIGLIGHEFGHAVAADHLSADFYRSLERWSGFIAVQMRDNPALFAPGASQPGALEARSA